MPIRRYLRYHPTETLELRIFPSPPSLESTYLLHPSHPALPSLIESLKPIILSLLSSAIANLNNKAQGATKKLELDKRIWRNEEVECSLYLKDVGAGGGSGFGRGVVVRRDRVWIQKKEEEKDYGPVVIREEEDEDSRVNLEEIPTAEEVVDEAVQSRARPRRQGRGRTRTYAEEIVDADLAERKDEVDGGGGCDEDDFAPLSGDSDVEMRVGPEEDTDTKDGKKMLPHVKFEGFKTLGLVLCIVVTKREKKATDEVEKTKGRGGGTGKGKAKEMEKEKEGESSLLEDWVAGSQMAGRIVIDD